MTLEKNKPTATGAETPTDVSFPTETEACPTIEEKLAELIDRLKWLNSKFPCRENAIVITKLEESLMWLEKRTKDRQARGVEGKHVA